MSSGRPKRRKRVTNAERTPERARLADPDKRARRAAVVEIALRDDAEAAELLDIALDDTDRLVRFRAVEGLAKIDDPRALEVLLARMDDESENNMMRRFALDSVIAIGTPAAADALEARIPTFDSRRGQKMIASKVAKIRKRHAG